MKEIIATTGAPGAIGPYSQATKAGSLVFVSGQLPIDPALAKLTDDGCIEQFDGHWLDGVVETLLRK